MCKTSVSVDFGDMKPSVVFTDVTQENETPFRTTCLPDDIHIFVDDRIKLASAATGGIKVGVYFYSVIR